MRHLKPQNLKKFARVLKRTPPFSTLSDSQCQMFLEREAQLLFAEQGKVLLNEGQTANCFFIVLAGKVEIFSGHLATQVKEVIPAGEIVGDIEFFSGRTRLTSVRTKSSAILMRIDEAALNALPHSVVSVIKNRTINSLMDRIEVMHEQHKELSNKVQKTNTEVSYLHRQFAHLLHEYPHIRSRFEDSLLNTQ